MQIREMEGKLRVKREKAAEAIAMATQGRWAEAVEANRLILSLLPDDVEALNRLGKALSELGRYSEAREAFGRALETSPSNTIARKNLERLAGLSDAPSTGQAEGVIPNLFIEERGKTCITDLRNLSPAEVLTKVAVGDVVSLRKDGTSIRMENARGEYLGEVEPKLARRLVRLMDGGNRYAAGVTGAGTRRLSIIIREMYQHPRLMDVVSFPCRHEETGVPLNLPEELGTEEVAGGEAGGWGAPEDAERGGEERGPEGSHREAEEPQEEEEEE